MGAERTLMCLLSGGSWWDVPEWMSSRHLYLDPFEYFVKETLRLRHYLRYMDDFVILADNRQQAREYRAAVGSYLRDRLLLQLNPRRVVMAPLNHPRDVLGYVLHADGRVRVRRRSGRRLWRRLPALAAGRERQEISVETVQASLASWLGLARHADAFRLSRAIFAARDVENLGKWLMIRSIGSRK